MSSRRATDTRQGRVTLPSADPSLGPGDVLGGKYRIEAEIAEGGMGVVLRATHLDLACPVAIKLIRPEHAANEVVVARLLGEARILASLRSEHVNRVLDVGRTDGGIPYLVLEYMEGSDLGNYLQRRGRLPVSEAADHVLHACEALAEAHAIGIVHRDLKPENLFLSEHADGGFVLKVFDFGISKAPSTRSTARTLTDPSGLLGSPCYMSPEQISGVMVDERSDIWALGAVLYELCSGELLFDADTITEIFSKILAPDWVLPQLEVGPASAQLHRVLSKCLQQSADERYQTVVELALDLAPLGTDPLQAARVAKVAVAARARAIGRPDSSLVGGATPLALTSSQLEIEVVDAGSERRPRRRWVVPALSAVAVLLLGAGSLVVVAGQRRAAAAGLPASLAPAQIQLPTARIAAESAGDFDEPRGSAEPVVLDEVPLVTASDKSVFSRPSQPSRPIAQRAPVFAATSRTIAAVEPAPAVALPPAQAAVSDPSAIAPLPKPSTAATERPKAIASDAWDTKTFGGRR